MSSICVTLLQMCDKSTKEIKNACEMTVMQILVNYGWRFRDRIK
jgi:hypothetical protein